MSLFVTSCLKSSRNKKELNDVTAAPFSVSFFQLPAAKKTTENGAAVTSLRSFLFRDDFSICHIFSVRFWVEMLGSKASFCRILSQILGGNGLIHGESFKY